MPFKLIAIFYLVFGTLRANGTWHGQSGKQTPQNHLLSKADRSQTVSFHGLFPTPEHVSFESRPLAEPQLLISSSEGISYVALHSNASTPPEPKPLGFNTSNPSEVQCDTGRGHIYWASSNGDSFEILRASVTGRPNKPEVVIWWERKGS